MCRCCLPSVARWWPSPWEAPICASPRLIRTLVLWHQGATILQHDLVHPRRICRPVQGQDHGPGVSAALPTTLSSLSLLFIKKPVLLW